MLYVYLICLNFVCRWQHFYHLVKAVFLAYNIHWCVVIDHICGGVHDGLMVRVLVPRSSFPGSSPDQGHCVVFLGKTLNSNGAFLHPGVKMGTVKFLGKPNLKNYGKVTHDRLASHPGEVEILLPTLCYINQYKLWQLQSWTLLIIIFINGELNKTRNC